MKLIHTRELTPSLIQELLSLKEQCESHAGKTYSFQPDDQALELSYRYYLIYENNMLISALIVSVLCDSDSPFADFFAMTAPKYRDQGLFSDLYDEMLEDLEEEFPAGSVSFDLYIEKETHLPGFLENLGYEKMSSEYLMEISENSNKISAITLKETSDYELLSNCYSRIFKVTKEQSDIAFENLKDFDTWYLIQKEDLLLGMVLLMKESDRLYLSNFGILPEYRRCGYAKEALQSIQNTLSASISLQVSSENPAALSLYQSYGFYTTKEILSYHGEF